MKYISCIRFFHPSYLALAILEIIGIFVIMVISASFKEKDLKMEYDD
jgi:hypothetical protein